MLGEEPTMSHGSGRTRLAGAFLLVGFLGSMGVGQEHDDGPKLADLLNAPDWGAEPPGGQPADDLGPKDAPPEEQIAREVPDAAVPQKLQDLVAERNAIIDQSRMFETLPDIFRHENQCAQRWVVLQQCLKRQRIAAGTVDQIRALGGKAAPGALERALQEFRNAQRDSEAAHGVWRQEINALQPLYERVRPAIAKWLSCYQRMRSLLRPDRRDPNRRGVLNVLDAAILQRDDFYEGHVLAALSEIYDGDADAALKHLGRARAGFDKFRLYDSVFAHDWCDAYLLLGQPGSVEQFVAEIRKLDALRQTSVRCWLVGRCGMLQGRDNEADGFFQKALTKAKVFTEKGPPAGVEPLLGDAALFYLTANQEAKRNVDKARKILEEAPRGCDDWRVIRARAALAAADGAWDDAIKRLDACRGAAPPTIDGELAAQREAYGSKEPWSRPRPPGKAAALPVKR